jgi:putative peptide zinc metalloprotease protein
VAGVLVLVRALLDAARLPATAVETQLIDAVLRPGGAAAPPVGLDALAARVQLSAYAQLTGAFDRHATALAGARELGLLACAVLVAALVVLAHGLGVRPPVTVAVLGALAAVPAAVGVLVAVGPGLLGATWLTLGAALLAQRRPGLRAVGLPAVVAGVVSAPVLAVTVLVGGAAVLVALRRGCNALVLGVAVAATVLPLALLPAPGGAVVVPLLVVVAVLVGFVLADEIVDRAVRSRARPTVPGRSS